jgi:hypothetical protein
MSATAQSRRARRMGRLALLALMTTAVLLGATRLSRQLFERPRAASSSSLGATHPSAVLARTDPVTGDAATQFLVLEAEGEVEALRDGQWVALPRGEIVALSDVIRTGPRSRAVLRLGGSTEVELREKVQIRLDRLSKSETSVDLVRGKVFAHVARAGDRLTISASETRTSNDGATHYIVKAEQSGRVSVAVTDGSARFASGGREVILGPGTESRSERGGVPAEPERIPEEVLLTVVWPEGEHHGARPAVVTGSARPSSTVTVNQASVTVGADGRFKVPVALHAGSNPIKVEVEDLVGRQRTETATVDRLPGRAPELTPVSGPLWNQ